MAPRVSPPARARSPLRRLRALILPITQARGVRNVRIFGSFARGEERKTSDVDLLVDLPDRMTLFELSTCDAKY